MNRTGRRDTADRVRQRAGPGWEQQRSQRRQKTGTRRSEPAL